MNRFKTLVIVAFVAVLVLTGLLVAAEPAQAQSSRYTVLCLTNDTAASIQYRYRWGSEPWKSSTLDEGEVDIHSWSSSRYPNFEISFDSDVTSGHYSYDYDLDGYLATKRNCTQGKNYAFMYQSSRQIDLYEID